MVDTYVSGAYGEICEGSTPFSDTIKKEWQYLPFFFIFNLETITFILLNLYFYICLPMI